jgi:hypothetical protein
VGKNGSKKTETPKVGKNLGNFAPRRFFAGLKNNV